MKAIRFLIPVTAAALLTNCATVTPKELIDARSAYQAANEGQARQLVPAELHKAQQSLALAEKSFKEDPESYKTRDLAYIAQRKAQLAGTLGAIAGDKANKAKAEAEFQNQQAKIIKEGQRSLSDAEEQRAIADKQANAELRARQAEMILAGKQSLSDSERRTADALAELAKLGEVKEQKRGLSITLSGGVLFRSGQSILLPSAQGKLDEVAQALIDVPMRNLIVEGHTDSQGSEDYNQHLSQRRADAVRDYIVRRGYPANRIQALGRGKGNPIADNTSPEGRANNRRVEIIIERIPQTSSR